MMQIENTTDGMLNHTFPGIVRTSITSYHIMTIVTGILAGISNGLLLIAMVRYRSTFFTSKGAYLIANLAIADLLTVLNFSLWGLNNAFRLSQALGEAILTISWSSTEASFLTILVMSLERYIAIVYPLKAQVWLSKSRTIKSCVAIWFIAAVCGACMSLYPLTAKFCFTIVFQITNSRHNVLQLQDCHQAEGADGDFVDVYAVERYPGYAQQRTSSAGAQADGGSALAGAHLDHHGSAIHICIADYLRAAPVHGGQQRLEITTFCELLLPRWNHELRVQPDCLRVALAQVSFSSGCELFTAGETRERLSQDPLALILC